MVTTVIETIRNTHPLASLLDEKKNPSFSRPALLLPSNLHNPSIAKCSPAVRALFAPIYDHITPGKLSVPAIQALVETSIPALKFPRGCLFIAGGPYSALRPLLRIGDVPLERYEYLVKESDTAILATPYSWIPYRGFGKGITGAITQSISNGLQSSKHSGIFYLELLTDTTEESAEMMYRFTAIEKSLLHALGEID